MPRSLHAQMTRSAISPRFAIRIFLNGPDAKEGFSVFHCLAVLHELALDDAGHVGFDLVHQLHRFDDAEDFAGRDMLADAHEGRRIGRSGFVESADDGAFRVDQRRVRISPGAFRASGPARLRAQARRSWRTGHQNLVEPCVVNSGHRTNGGCAHGYRRAALRVRRRRYRDDLDQLPDLFICHAIDIRLSGRVSNAGREWQGARTPECHNSFMPAIAVRDLRKIYGGKAAVDGLNLTVPRGSFFGFLGPNGAGKSTTIRMLTGLIPPTSGSIELLGHAARGQRDGDQTANRPGHRTNRCFSTASRARSSSSSSGRMYHLARPLAKHRAQEFLELFELTNEQPQADRRILERACGSESPWRHR